MYLATMRYKAQEIILGKEGQEKLEKSTAAVVGCGGTGSVIAELLARAGVSLVLIDRDIVEEGNLHRQLYEEEDVNKMKAEALKERLKKVNSKVKIDAIPDDLNAENIEDYLENATIIMDGTDNMETRFLINDYCRKNGKTFVYSAAIRDKGMVCLLRSNGPCLRCIVPKPMPNESCETAGVLPTITAAVGTMAANEAIKFLTNYPSEPAILFMNVLREEHERIKIKNRRNCPACSGNYEYLEASVKNVHELCAGSYQIRYPSEIDVAKLEKNIRKSADIIASSSDVLVLDYNGKKVTIFRSGRMIVGAENEKEAKILANRFVSL